MHAIYAQYAQYAQYTRCKIPITCFLPALSLAENSLNAGTLPLDITGKIENPYNQLISRDVHDWQYSKITKIIR